MAEPDEPLHPGQPAAGWQPFELVPREGPVLRSSDLKIVAGPVIEEIATSANSPRAADHLPGRQIRVELEDAPAKLRVTWMAILHDGANYVRQEITIHAEQEPFPLTQVNLVDAIVPGAAVSGRAKGSPVTAGTWFLGFEHPLSECRVRGDRVSCWLSRELPLRAGQSVTFSSVFGIAHPAQLRRDFLKYVELERAHPYRTFLHYNSWYDLGYFDRYNEQGALEVVQSFGEQLAKQRTVKLDSFLFDDGWDDPTTLWKFNPGFPDGLTKVAQTAAKYGAAPGIWLSPWGGYDKPKQQRLASARARGFETNEGGFALSGPKYYRYFRDTCLDLIEKYGINQFKFDGTATPTRSSQAASSTATSTPPFISSENCARKSQISTSTLRRNLSLTVLVALCRFDLARRRRPQLCRRRHQSAALDDVP